MQTEVKAKYNIYPIKWDGLFEPEIQMIYKMFKDQEHRIFTIDTYYNYDNILDVVKDMVENDKVFVVASTTGEVMASFILEDAILFKDIITEVKIHCAIRRPFWGPAARDICKSMREYLKDNYRIKKLIAEVPQCKYGIIKLLKDVGFKHEGTLKTCLLYLDKNNQPKWYDKLIYTLTREDI